MKTFVDKELINGVCIGLSTNKYALEISEQCVLLLPVAPCLLYRIMQRLIFGFEWMHNGSK